MSSSNGTRPREWLIPITPDERLLLIDAAVQTRRVVKVALAPPMRLLVRGEQDRWAVELLARERGVDVRGLYGN